MPIRRLCWRRRQWAGLRNNALVADIPGVQLRFTKADTAQASTKGRILDHIGFDVKDLKAFIKTLEANNIKLDRPYSVNDSGVGIAFITDIRYPNSGPTYAPGRMRRHSATTVD